MEDSKEEDSREMMGGQQGGEWFNIQNREDYDAYLKWCEENRARNAEYQEQQRLLDMFKQREEAKKEEDRKMKIQQEAKEKKQNMMAEWKQWEKQMEMVASFDKLGYEIMEMKGKYYYTVTIEDAQQRGDPNSIAQVLVNMSKGDQIKAFFAGLKEAMCDGAEAYVEQVEAWEKQFKFLERLM